VVKMPAVAFWIVTSCGHAFGYQRFRVAKFKMEAMRSSKTLVPTFKPAWCNDPENLCPDILRL
jgi:fatty-acid desaturase